MPFLDILQGLCEEMKLLGIPSNTEGIVGFKTNADGDVTLHFIPTTNGTTASSDVPAETTEPKRRPGRPPKSE